MTAFGGEAQRADVVAQASVHISAGLEEAHDTRAVTGAGGFEQCIRSRPGRSPGCQRRTRQQSKQASSA